MKRRSFIKSAGAIATLPLLPAKALTAPIASNAATPAAARFWGIYMAQLHGTVTPKMLGTITNVSPQLASTFLKDMIAKGAINASAVDFGFGAVAQVNPKQNSLGKRLTRKFEKNFRAFTKEETTPTLEREEIFNEETTVQGDEDAQRDE